MSHLIALIEQYGLAVVFVNVFIEQLGAPVPAYPTLVVTGALLNKADYSGASLLLTAVVAAVAADCLWYAAGKRYGRRVLAALCRISLSPDSCVQHTQSIYTRWGAASLLVAKFIPGFASVGSALAGTARTRLVPFLFFDMLGAALWAGLAIYLGSLFSSAVDDLLDVLESLGKWGMLLLGIALAAFIARRWLQRRRFLYSLRMERVSADELHRLQQAGMPLTVIDVRPAVMQADGRIPGAMTLTLDQLRDPVSHLRFEGEVVVYCTCPNEASAAVIAKGLMQRGVSRVRPLSGGLDAWIAAGYAIERDELAEAGR